MSENRRSRKEKPAKKPKHFVWLALPAAFISTWWRLLWLYSLSKIKQ